MRKRTRMALAILSATMLFAGCWGKEDPPEEPQVLTAEQRVEAYEKLQTISKKSFVDTEKSEGMETTISLKNKVSQKCDFTNSGLTQLEIDELDSSLYSPFFEIGLSVGAKIVSGYKPNGTGYAKTFGDFGGFQSMVGQEITNNVNGQYLNYVLNKDDSTKYVYKVDDKYSNYMYNINNPEVSDQIEFPIDDFENLFGVISQKDTYDDFVVATTGLSEDLLKSNMLSVEMENVPTIDFEQDTTTATINFTVFKEIYTLEINYNINDYVEEGVNWDLSSQVVIEYDKNSWNNIKIEVAMDSEETIKCLDVLDQSEYTTTFTDQHTVKKDAKSVMSYSISAGQFNNTLMSESSNGYVGTGENGAVENKSNFVMFQCPGFDDLNIEDVECLYGQNVYDTFNTIAEEELYFYDSFESFELYWDKNFEQAVSAQDTFPSYYKPLYFKAIPPENETYVEVLNNFVSDGYVMQYYDSDFYDANSTLVFADLIDDETIIEVEVNGVVVDSESIVLDGGKCYSIKITY